MNDLQVAILTDQGGRCWDRGRATRLIPCSGCDPHRPRGAGAGSTYPTTYPPDQWLRSSPTTGAGAGWVATPPVTTSLKLRSSPTTGGRCWPHRVHAIPERRRCDPHRPRGAGAGRPSPRWFRPAPCCDPHRPRGAGAGLAGLGDDARHPLVAILTDHGGPVLGCSAATRTATPSGCDPHRPRGPVLVRRPADPRVQLRVAILTDHGGAVLVGQGVGRRGLDGVAILTDHGGPVLAVPPPALRRADSPLRSSPTTGGRCWRSPTKGTETMATPLRSSPTTGGRCWQRQCPHGGVSGDRVAILTDHGGPVLAVQLHGGGPHRRKLRSSPTTGGRCWRRPRMASPLPTGRCDPHRPRGAGAGVGGWLQHSVPGRVAILTDHGGPVLARWMTSSDLDTIPSLRSSPTTGGRCWTTPSQQSLLNQSGLRSSPTTGGRCWRGSPSAAR